MRRLIATACAIVLCTSSMAQDIFSAPESLDDKTFEETVLPDHDRGLDRLAAERWTALTAAVADQDARAIAVLADGGVMEIGSQTKLEAPSQSAVSIIRIYRYPVARRVAAVPQDLPIAVTAIGLLTEEQDAPG